MNFGDKVVLDTFQQVDGVLVSGGPQLTAVVQPWLDKTAQSGKHQVPAPSPKCAECPPCHVPPRLHSHLHQFGQGEKLQVAPGESSVGSWYLMHGEPSHSR